MFHIRPLRASTPPPSTTAASVLVSEVTEDSRASGLTVPELVGLGPEEIDFIDEVINRAPATASTFLTVFKAYNDILQERGLDPQNEVVYYGKLLKIGTLKGKSWADKWNMVKDQQGYTSRVCASGGRRTHVSRTTPTPAKPTPKSTAHARHTYPANTPTPGLLDDATHTEDESDPHPAALRHRTDTYTHIDTPRTRRPFMSPATLTSNNSLGLDTGPPAQTPDSRVALHQNIARRAVGSRPNARWDAETTAGTETTTHASPSIPPSYGAAVRDAGPSSREKVLALLHKSRESPHPTPSTSAVTPPYVNPTPGPRSRRGSTIDADEAWKNIRMAQDEVTADEYRKNRLVERCWDVWKQGAQWIITTGEQIAEARDSLILRRALHQWRKRTAERREYYLRVAALSDRRCLKRALHVWKLKFKEKKQVHWREDMRARMKAVRDRDELRLKKDAWAKWRQSYRSHLSEQQFQRKLVRRFFERWKTRVGKLDEFDAAAEHFVYAKEERIVERGWDLWRRATELRLAEKSLRDRVDLRIMATAMDMWRKNSQNYQIADVFHDRLAVKHALVRWKAAQQRIRALENRASKHCARQDEVLVRAIMRVWKAHERGKLLTRVRSLRLLRQAWAIWKHRMEEQKEQEELAQLFATRSASILAGAALKKWRAAYSSHQNALTFAVHYHRAQVQYKMLLTWRLGLRAKLRMAKQAKVAQKQLLLRRYLHMWTAKIAEKQRERKLKEFQLRVAKQYFLEWMANAKRRREMKLAEEIVRQQLALRVMSETLTHWTNRVADRKFKELETTHNYEKTLVLRAFAKWKVVSKRHADEYSLMESYQDIKREESMRKMFNRWLTAARKVRHRRLDLQAREDEFKLTVVAAAWDRWRERFQDIRLLPMADAFHKQRQRDLLFRAFAIWHSKSRSLPAVRFQASNLKGKYWKKWRDAMPRALQAKAARDMDRRITLSKAFAHWHKTYKTKVELKAIARARYLNLTPAVPRQPRAPLRPPTLSAPLRPRITPRRARPPSPSEDEADVRPAAAAAASTPLFAKPSASRRSGLASLLAPRSGSPERPKLSSRRTAASTLASRFPSPGRADPEREREPARARARTQTEEPTPTQTLAPLPPPSSASAFGGVAAWRKEVRPPKSAPSSVAGDGARSSLWHELKEVRRKARAPTERAHSPAPL